MPIVPSKAGLVASPFCCDTRQLRQCRSTNVRVWPILLQKSVIF